MKTFQTFFQFGFLVLITAALAGCSTLSGAECRSMDWFKKGKADANDGIPAERFSEYQNQCQAYGETLNPTEYLKGHNEALPQYHMRMKSLFEAKNQCTTDADCNKNVTCSAEGLCPKDMNGNRAPCKFSSDCGSSKQCKTETREFGSERATANVCK